MIALREAENRGTANFDWLLSKHSFSFGHYYDPKFMGFFYSRDLHRSMREEIASGDFDLVFVHCSSAAQYVRDAQGIASILDFGDMERVPPF